MNVAKNACFRGDHRSVLDFITGLLVKDSVKRVAITREKDSWKVDVTGLRHERKRSSNLIAGLHDLYW